MATGSFPVGTRTRPACANTPAIDADSFAEAMTAFLSVGPASRLVASTAAASVKAA